jgi:hypothetical protein
LYTNEARKIVAVPNRFGFVTPLSEVLSVICTRSNSRRLRAENSLRVAFRFGKAKSTMFKIVSSDSSPRWTPSRRFGERPVLSRLSQPMNIR